MKYEGISKFLSKVPAGAGSAGPGTQIFSGRPFRSNPGTSRCFVKSYGHLSALFCRAKLDARGRINRDERRKRT